MFAHAHDGASEGQMCVHLSLSRVQHTRSRVNVYVHAGCPFKGSTHTHTFEGFAHVHPRV